MGKYSVEKENEYINIYDNEVLYQQIKCPVQGELSKIMFEKAKEYYEKKNLEPYVFTMPDTKKEDNPVEHPSHYNTGKIEVIEAIDDWKLSFSLGNAIKYIARAGKKDPDKTIEDLEKAKWYIEHEIESIRKNQEDERLGKAYKNYKEAINKAFKKESENERKRILGPTE